MTFCDFKCVYAATAREEMDGARSCMTFTAIWCDLYKRHVMKSQRCTDRKERNYEKELSAEKLE